MQHILIIFCLNPRQVSQTVKSISGFRIIFFRICTGFISKEGASDSLRYTIILNIFLTWLPERFKIPGDSSFRVGYSFIRSSVITYLPNDKDIIFRETSCLEILTNRFPSQSWPRRRRSRPCRTT